jgi:chitin synthase
MLTNAGLAIAIENINGLQDTTNSADLIADEQALRNRQNNYFAFILYSTFGLAVIRFIGVSPSVVPHT